MDLQWDFQSSTYMNRIILNDIYEFHSILYGRYELIAKMNQVKRNL